MLSKHALDTYVAPRLSELTTVGAPDLRQHTEQREHWIVNFLLGTIFTFKMEDRRRQVALFFLRKTDGALQAYQEARDYLDAYLSEPAQAVSMYFHALRHFEEAATLAYQAFDTIHSIVEERLFGKDDATPLQRLNRLQNISKHANRELLGGGMSVDLPVPVWLSDGAIISHDTSLSWPEFADLLLYLARIAERIARLDIPDSA